MTNARVRVGLDRIADEGFSRLSGQRVGLLVHPASVDSKLRHAVTRFANSPVDLRALFGPQHGLRGETQDNMIEWEGYRDRATGLPVFSLYGEHRKPTAEMLALIDTLVVDLQDVGARYYTFVWTLLLCMEACAENGKRLVVLDRPNPISGQREGPLLDMDYRSFVGLAPIPIRHGLTIGELARFFRARFALDLELDVVAMEGWRRSFYFDECSLPWVLPSPNLPTLESTVVYPGGCLFEGTWLSEGRGTTRPFEIFGAPYVDPDALVHALEERALPGVVFRPLHFEPTFQKHARTLCGGAQIHVLDRQAYLPVRTGVEIVASIRRLWPDELRWLPPPYEYEEKLMPIDILAGSPRVRETIDAFGDVAELATEWESDVRAFDEQVREHELYD